MVQVFKLIEWIFPDIRYENKRFYNTWKIWNGLNAGKKEKEWFEKIIKRRRRGIQKSLKLWSWLNGYKIQLYIES